MYIYICASVHISSDIIFVHPSHDPQMLKLKPSILLRHVTNEEKSGFLLLPLPWARLLSAVDRDIGSGSGSDRIGMGSDRIGMGSDLIGSDRIEI